MIIGYAATAAGLGEPQDIPIVSKWSGDYPVIHLNRLPQDRQKVGTGYIDNTAIFTAVWRVFKPGVETPEVDFSRNFIVFVRNVDFYNRISIFKITLKEGVIEILAKETRSALAIEDKVAMDIAVIPREGVNFIQAGKERIPVDHSEPSADLLNSIFIIEGHEVRLIDGYHEKQTAPGSANTTATSPSISGRTAGMGVWAYPSSGSSAPGCRAGARPWNFCPPCGGSETTTTMSGRR